jgi:large subunit ribosomal protein L4
MPASQRRGALLSCLSQKAAESMIFALDSYATKAPKTKDFAAMLKKLPVKRSVLIVLAEKDPMIEKAARNIPNAKLILVNYLNLHDVLTYEHVMFLKPALKKAEELFLNK